MFSPLLEQLFPQAAGNQKIGQKVEEKEHPGYPAQAGIDPVAVLARLAVGAGEQNQILRTDAQVEQFASCIEK